MISWLTCDVFDGLATLEDGSIDLVVTSPPFLALRSYLPADHPDKGREIGSEATPAEFLDVMLRVVGELRRVLAPHGSIAIELGDTYAGSGGAGGDYDPGGWREGQEAFVGSGKRIIDAKYERVIYGDHKAGIPNLHGKTQGGGVGWPLAKSKTLIPELFRVALAYGFNPLTGEPSPAGRWRVRNVVTWCRPNPPVGALGDKWRPATSDIVVACVSGRRFWDDLATRKPSVNPIGVGVRPTMARVNGHDENDHRDKLGPFTAEMQASGAPLLDYWEISPTGYAGAHYAVYPSALVEPLVKAMVPQRVCRTCGEPSRRIVETTYDPNDPSAWGGRAGWSGPRPTADSQSANKGSVQHNDGKTNPSLFVHGRAARIDSTVGFTDCGHDDWRPGRVLDPFAGSGTTLAVASGHGHDAIGFDLDPRNEELARDRVGPLLWQS